MGTPSVRHGLESDTACNAFLRCRSDNAGTILRQVVAFPPCPWLFSTPTSLLHLCRLHGLRHLAFCRLTDSGASGVQCFTVCLAIPVTAACPGPACPLRYPVPSPLVRPSLVPSLSLLGRKQKSVFNGPHIRPSVQVVFGGHLRPRSHLDSVWVGESRPGLHGARRCRGPGRGS